VPRISLSDVEELGPLGEGSFGVVKMVRWRGEVAALKALSKFHVSQARQVQHVIRERRLLGSVRHPSVVNLQATAVDNNKLYALEIQFCVVDVFRVCLALFLPLPIFIVCAWYWLGVSVYLAAVDGRSVCGRACVAMPRASNVSFVSCVCGRYMLLELVQGGELWSLIYNESVRCAIIALAMSCTVNHLCLPPLTLGRGCFVPSMVVLSVRLHTVSADPRLWWHERRCGTLLCRQHHPRTGVLAQPRHRLP